MLLAHAQARVADRRDLLVARGSPEVDVLRDGDGGLEVNAGDLEDADAPASRRTTGSSRQNVSRMNSPATSPAPSAVYLVAYSGVSRDDLALVLDVLG